eukprot:7468649-Lingulodinium_polyedra.AAC.1
MLRRQRQGPGRTADRKEERPSSSPRPGRSKDRESWYPVAPLRPGPLTPGTMARLALCRYTCPQPR